jgi:hypothetical protein
VVSDPRIFKSAVRPPDHRAGKPLHPKRCIQKEKTLTGFVRVLYFTLKNNKLCYFTLSTIALNAAGWFMAKSAKTFLLISIAFFFNNPMNCEYDIPSKRVAALIRCIHNPRNNLFFTFLSR